MMFAFGHAHRSVFRAGRYARLWFTSYHPPTRNQRNLRIRPRRYTSMPSASPDQSNQNPTLAQRLLAVGEPRFPVFEQQRRAGVPPSPSNTELPPGTLAIPEETPAIELLPESVAATWLTTNVRSAEDILFARIPAWGVQGVTTCIFPKVVAQSWPQTPYGPIDKAESSCLRVKDIRGKGKGCVAARGVPRGELVARERALLVMPRTCVAPQHFVGAATNTMTPNQRAAFFALHDCKSSGDKGNNALGIICSNSFLIPGVPGHDVLYSGVFETFSRLNHRCGSPPRFMVPQVVTSQVLSAVARMRCLNGIMKRSLEKSERCGRYQERKR